MIGKTEIVIGGKSRRMSFGQNAWFLFCQMQGIKPGNIHSYMGDQLTNPAAFRDIIFCGLKVSDLALNVPVDYNQYTVGDWLDELEAEKLAEVIECILGSLGVPTDKPVIKKKASKK